jgi:hypothetical protein
MPVSHAVVADTAAGLRTLAWSDEEREAKTLAELFKDQHLFGRADFENVRVVEL